MFRASQLKALDSGALVVTARERASAWCRFLKTDKLQTLYDFVDTSEPVEEWPHGSYLLVTSRPRKVQPNTCNFLQLQRWHLDVEPTAHLAAMLGLAEMVCRLWF